MLREMRGYTFGDGRAAVARGIFGAGSGFRVGWRIAGGGGWFPLALGGGGGFNFGGGAGHCATILWGLDTFLISPNFLRSLEVLCRSATREVTRIYHVYK